MKDCKKTIAVIKHTLPVGYSALVEEGMLVNRACSFNPIASIVKSVVAECGDNTLGFTIAHDRVCFRFGPNVVAVGVFCLHVATFHEKLFSCYAVLCVVGDLQLRSMSHYGAFALL